MKRKDKKAEDIEIINNQILDISNLLKEAHNKLQILTEFWVKYRKDWDGKSETP